MLRINLCLFVLLVALQVCTADLVNISNLDSSQARKLARVNLTALQNDESPDRISYSGYIAVDPKLTQSKDVNYFFWFFEAKNQPTTTKDIPVLVWLQGGPGCSSLLALFYENGPYQVIGGTDLPLNQQLAINPHSWANDFHMIFIDNPVGSGFSYGNIDAYVRTGTQMASYLENALAQFFTVFPEYHPNPFYIFGESYAGHYIPQLAGYIQKKNPPSIINLKGMGIGNGYTDCFHQIMVTSEMAFNIGFADEYERDRMRKYERLVQANILSGHWEDAYLAREMVYEIFSNASGGVNVYDYRTYTQNNYTPIVRYVNQDQVRSILHVGDHTFDKMCDDVVASFLTADSVQSASGPIPDLLDQYPILFYQGQFDVRDGVASVEAVLMHLNWTGVPAFLKADKFVWKNEGNSAGSIKSYKNLYQCVVFGAGHLVPFNQPVASLEMVRKFVYNLPWTD